MLLHKTDSPDAVPMVDRTDTLDGLEAIYRKGCAAALWHRDQPSGFRDWIDGLDEALLPKARLILKPDAVKAAVTQVCDAQGTPETAQSRWLIDDIATLAASFATVMRSPFLRVRLDVVTTNACRKFHIDAVTARLVCTYRGTGTQYGVSHDGAEPTEVITAPTGAPIVLRGTRWPGEEPPGLLHRSPPIAGTGETRLLLVLDPVHTPDEDDD